MIKRIVVTGMGVVTSLGDNKSDYFNNLMRGVSGVSKISSINVEKIDCKIGGDLGNYDFKKKLKEFEGILPENVFIKLRKLLKSSPFSTKLSLISAISAYIDAGLFDNPVDSERISCYVGGSNMHDNYIVKNILQFQEEPEYVDPLTGIVMFDTDTVSCIAETLGINGAINTIGGACAASGFALKHALNSILLDDAEVCIVGGGALDYSHIGLHCMSIVGVLGFNGFNDAPEKASRPFDRDRRGFIFSHGSGAIVIEELSSALKRGALIYAEILAVGVNNDANHLANPSSKWQTQLMKNTVKNAGVAPEEIDYINAHATSTQLGDITEIESVKSSFGDQSKNLKINAPKSMLGHTGWGAHVIELIGAIMQMVNSKLHPSINIDNLDERIDLDVCQSAVENYSIRHLLKNSFGIGGYNCCTILRNPNLIK